VFDIHRRVLRDSNPDATARQWDFYAVEGIPGVGRNDVEDGLMIMEGKWAEALRQVTASKSMVSNEVYSDVMNFTTFLAVRSRRFRNLVADFVDRSERMQLSGELASPEGGERFRSITIQAIESKGRHLTRVERKVLDDPEPFREMVNRGQVVIDYDQTWHVQRMMENALILTFILGDRHWAIWTAEDSLPDFVCSDSPVCLTWKIESLQQPPPGFEKKNTWVTLPLSCRMALVGSYEPQASNRDVSAEDVAWLNSLTTRFATEIYGASLSAWKAPR
jgi:hypothetical protein